MPLEKKPDAHEPEQQLEEVAFDQEGTGHTDEDEHSDHGPTSGHHQHQMTGSYLSEPSEEHSQWSHLLVPRATDVKGRKDNLLEDGEWETT